MMLLYRESEAASRFFRRGNSRSEGLSDWPKVDITCRKSQVAEGQTVAWGFSLSSGVCLFYVSLKENL